MAIKNVLEELAIPSNKRVIVSGVGCSGKASQYIDGYAAETLHGRTLPFATGVKIADSSLIVIAIGGDGDWYGIGMGHFIHACRRDINITYIVFNNENYALTTWQASPTTPIWVKTKTTPDWNSIYPLDPVNLAIQAGCSFARRATDLHFSILKEIIKDAIQHKGFSLVDVSQTCPSFKRW